MAHIHLTGTLVARAEEDAFTRSSSFYVRLTDGQATRIYLPAHNAAHAHAIATAINGAGRLHFEDAPVFPFSEGR